MPERVGNFWVGMNKPGDTLCVLDSDTGKILMLLYTKKVKECLKVKKTVQLEYGFYNMLFWRDQTVEIIRVSNGRVQYFIPVPIEPLRQLVEG